MFLLFRSEIVNTLTDDDKYSRHYRFSQRIQKQLSKMEIFSELMIAFLKPTEILRSEILGVFVNSMAADD